MDRDVAGNLGFNKLTIIFPPGDQLTSVLYEKEKDTKIDDLINRLCALRGIDLTQLKNVKILDDVGEKVDRSKTVGESGLVFIEIVDKTTEKEKKKQKKEKEKTRERPSSVKLTVGKNCYLPLEDQLFDDEKAALNVVKQLEDAKYFSDEFIMATLFSKKFDLKRTEEFLKNSLAWRREKGFMKLPKFSELNMNSFEIVTYLPGARDKLGRSIRCLRLAKSTPNINGQTVEEFTKFATWLHYVGIFHDGIDGLRNGCCIVAELEGFGWKNFDIDFQRQTAQLWTDRFPLLMRKFLMLHPPVIFAAINKIMATITKDKIMDRIETLNTKDIKKFIDLDNLPAEFGGNVNYSAKDWIVLLGEWAEKCEERLSAPGRDD